MLDEVRACVEAKINSVETYLDVPAGGLDSFKAELMAFAEPFSNATAFETAFAQSPLNQQFMGFYTKFPPKPYTMTAEDKAFVRQTTKEMFEENKSQIVQDALADAADAAMLEAKSAARTARRQAMIEAGVFDDYTRASNKVDDVKILAGLFRKKK
ncbi:MAG: hypothetical protein IKH67_01170 [Lachnospiraceae bacterium]|nr:hypothetical protein [Lachnospiraceae bacterium]MBR6350042.1 hypothetical protein [Lachnospiraceae bacterium]